MSYSTSPETDAERHLERADSEDHRLQCAQAAADQEITQAFAAFYAGNALRRVPTIRCRIATTELMETTQTVPEAIADGIQDGAPLAALVALLQGTGDVAALRNALVRDYAERNADSIAQQRVIFEPMRVLPFLMQEAA